MALRPLQAKREPLGQFDVLDADATALLGGEVVSFTYISTTGTDVHAKDVEDGYVATPKTRPAVTKVLVSGMRPLFLADEGTLYYGSLYGQVVGSSAGQDTAGAQLGPHSTAGSGKCTLWGAEGLYAVTLDAVDTTNNTGLVSQNQTLAGNDALYATAAGKLTPRVAAAFEAVVVGRFIEFQSLGSLVRTPSTLVQALNSPPGATAAGASFDHAVIYFSPGL